MQSNACKYDANEADLRYDNTDPTVYDSPFLVNNSLFSLFSDCTISAIGLKISNANSIFSHKNFIGTAKEPWIMAKVSGISF